MSFDGFIEKHTLVDTSKVRLLSREGSQIQYKNLQNEMSTLLHWINQGNLENEVNSLGHLLFHTLSNLKYMGINIDGVMEEISKSELSKEGEHWTPPDLAQFCQTTNEVKGIVVLEGTDCSGKSTLAKEICKQFGGSIIHHTWNEELEKNYDKYMFNSFIEIIGRSKHELVIVDRAWISEYLYAKVYRNGTKWHGIQQMLSGALKNNNALNIYCRVKDYEAHDERFKESKEKGKELYDDVTKVTREYNRAWDTGIQGLGDGSPIRKWENYIEYSIEDNGSYLENFVYLAITDHF